MHKESFRIAIPDAVLQDLRERLTRTHWPIDFANTGWAYGTNRAYLEELVDYWLHTYDWRKHEQEMNTFSHYKTTIDDVPLHFIHEPGKGPHPIPLI
ncbi:MAG: epoxide hydrolase N-terminal domain-containing protein, partial [Candidatus Binatia bacterium]